MGTTENCQEPGKPYLNEKSQSTDANTSMNQMELSDKDFKVAGKISIFKQLHKNDSTISLQIL